MQIYIGYVRVSTQNQNLLRVVFFAALIYGHQLAATIGRYVLDLEVVCQVLEPEEMANWSEYLPLG